MRICKAPNTGPGIHLGMIYTLTIGAFKHIDYSGIV